MTNLDEKKSQAVRLFAKGETPEEIAQKVSEPVKLVNFWCTEFSNIKKDLDKTSQEITQILESWHLAKIDEAKLREILQKSILLTGIKISALMPQENIMLDNNSAQALHIHSRTLQQLKELSIELDGNKNNILAVLSTPVDKRTSELAMQQTNGSSEVI